MRPSFDLNNQPCSERMPIGYCIPREEVGPGHAAREFTRQMIVVVVRIYDNVIEHYVGTGCVAWQ